MYITTISKRSVNSMHIYYIVLLCQRLERVTFRPRLYCSFPSCERHIINYNTILYCITYSAAKIRFEYYYTQNSLQSTANYEYSKSNNYNYYCMPVRSAAFHSDRNLDGCSLYKSKALNYFVRFKNHIDTILI